MNFVPLKTDLVGQPTGRLNFFTPDECRTIIANGENSLELKVSRTEDHRVHESVRSSEIGWLNPDPEHTWLFNRIKDCINDVNAQWFGYALIDHHRVPVDCTVRPRLVRLGVSTNGLDGVPLPAGRAPDRGRA
jgi:hypothetical protein